MAEPMSDERLEQIESCINAEGYVHWPGRWDLIDAFIEIRRLREILRRTNEALGSAEGELDESTEWKDIPRRVETLRSIRDHSPLPTF